MDVIMHLSVCVCVNACLLFDAIMKLQSILAIFIVILYIIYVLWGVS